MPSAWGEAGRKIAKTPPNGTHRTCLAMEHGGFGRGALVNPIAAHHYRIGPLHLSQRGRAGEWACLRRRVSSAWAP